MSTEKKEGGSNNGMFQLYHYSNSCLSQELE